MPCKHMHTSRAAAPRTVDDFTRIKGIGPIVNERLHSAGIHTFAQLAALSVETIASLIPNLSAKQVIKQSWIPQARELTSSKADARTVEKEPAISISRQHYENFTLEFLLSEKNKIRRLQIVHIQSGDVDTWTKWDAERLIDFLARHTGVRFAAAKGVVRVGRKPEQGFKPSTSAEPASGVSIEAVSMPAISQSEENIDSSPAIRMTKSTSELLVPINHPPSEITPQQVPSPAVSANTTNRICLLEWKLFFSNTKQILDILHHDQYFDVNLTLDLANASLPDTSLLDFNVSLYAKKLGDRTRQVIGETKSRVPYASIVDLTVRNATLPQGLCRLMAFVNLVPNDSSLPTGSGINASFQSDLFQVH